MKTNVNEKIIHNSNKKMKKLEILMVSTYPPDIDGIAAYTARLENALKEKISIKIAAKGRDWKSNSLYYVFDIIKKTIKTRVGVIHFQLSYFLFGNEYYGSIFPVLLLLIKLLRKKVVITFHDLLRSNVITNNFLKKYTTKRLLFFKKIAFINYTKIVCLIADKIIVHDEIGKNTLIHDYSIPEKKIQIIPHGIDQKPIFSKVQQSLLGKNFPKNKKSFIVTYFGLVKYGKGLEDLIKAWKLVRNVNAQLLIIGGKPPTNLNDDCLEKLTELVNELQLQESISFCGYIPDDELPIYFEASDVFVFPYNEWGDVIASSGALSVVAPYLKPIIATNVPAFHSLKKQGTAIIVERGNIEELAKAIQSVLKNKELGCMVSDKLCKWISDHDWLKIADKTSKLYGDLL